MFSVNSCPLPKNALLNVYRQHGAHTDCYFIDINRAVTHSQFVAKFYTTRLFKIERFILRWLVSKPSTDTQAMQLGAGQTDSFAAWTVESRTQNQLLLCDYLKHTRSWLMVEPQEDRVGPCTRLYFGSAVVPKKTSETGKTSMSIVFHALSWFHQWYSAALLSSAKSRLSTD